MNELRCEECGTVLEEGMRECPNCGCPISQQKIKVEIPVPNITLPKKSTEENLKPKSKKGMSIVSLIIGIIILVLGIVVVTKKVESPTYSANGYDVQSAKFGADFYTEIYGASDTIVDELNDINEGMECVSDIAVEIGNAIYFSAGMIIIALGLATIAFSISNMKKKDTM